MKHRPATVLQRRWYAPRPARWLMPFAALYGLLTQLRRRAYRRGWLKSRHPGVPVLVIGNITVGGSGKTPLTLALIGRLGARGRQVGVVARGYGGRAARYPLAVTAATPAAQAGDEPALLAQRSTAAIAVDGKRARAARWLVEHTGADFIIADDGLQHYALARDGEIAVTDGCRGLGNGALLPAGPLRETPDRLAEVDLALIHGTAGDFWLAADLAYRLDGREQASLARFAGQTIHAVAGIGDPARFFAMLRTFDLDIIEHPMPDHHRYSATDLDFGDCKTVLMTEKDAVKCRDFAAPRHWALPVSVVFSRACEKRVDALLDRLCARSGSARPNDARPGNARPDAGRSGRP